MFQTSAFGEHDFEDGQFYSGFNNDTLRATPPTSDDEDQAPPSGDDDDDNASDHEAVSGATGGRPTIVNETQGWRLPAAPAPGMPNMPPGRRLAHDRLKPLYAPVFPNLHRVYDTTSKAIAHVGWEFCTAAEIHALLNCKMLGAGKQESMTWFQNAATKFLHQRVSACATGQGDASSLQRCHLLSLVPALQWTREDGGNRALISESPDEKRRAD